MQFDRIAFRFRFLHNLPLREKLATVKSLWEKVLLTIEQFLFLKFEIMQWNGVISKEGFLN